MFKLGIRSSFVRRMELGVFVSPHCQGGGGKEEIVQFEPRRLKSDPFIPRTYHMCVWFRPP